MLSIGITGGIGSGKSVVSEIFRALGYSVFECDREAKALYDNDAELKRELIKLFGSKLYETAGGKLDRQQLGKIIFSSEEALKAVNALVHPAVRRAFRHWQEVEARRGAKLCFLESAILFQSELSEMLDYSLLIEADEALRLERACRRDGVDKELIRQRMACQMTENELKERANFSINNNEGQALLPQINKLLEQIL